MYLRAGDNSTFSDARTIVPSGYVYGHTRIVLPAVAAAGRYGCSVVVI